MKGQKHETDESSSAVAGGGQDRLDDTQLSATNDYGAGYCQGAQSQAIGQAALRTGSEKDGPTMTALDAILDTLNLAGLEDLRAAVDALIAKWLAYRRHR